MPRLPVSEPTDTENAASLTVKVSWAAFFVLVGLGLVWFFGIGVIDDWLQLDTQCSGKRFYNRQARIAESVGCALAQGPRGWLFLAWTAWWPALVIWSLERGLRRAVLARARASRNRPIED